MGLGRRLCLLVGFMLRSGEWGGEVVCGLSFEAGGGVVLESFFDWDVCWRRNRRALGMLL